MNILAMECSGRIVSVALQSQTEYREIYIDAGFRHIETLMPAVDTLFNLAEITPNSLDLIACSAGPGSFTGLRIGMATAKGIMQGTQCALKAVPTLPLLAADREHWPGIVVPVMDARKQRVYTAAFQSGQRITQDQDIALSSFLDSLPPDQKILITGPDAKIAEGLKDVIIDPLYSSSRGHAMVNMAIALYEKDGGDSPDIGPLYLRLSEAEIMLNPSSQTP